MLLIHCFLVELYINGLYLHCSKRISGFDMAPPASAILAVAAAVAGTCSIIYYLIVIFSFLLFSLSVLDIVWTVRIKLHGIIW